MKVYLVHFGPTPQVRPWASESSADVAYRCIGGNTVAGFPVYRFCADREGRPLRTPAGETLLVVALTGSRGDVFSAFAFVGEGGQ